MTVNERKEAGLETELVKIKDDDDEVCKYASVYICICVCKYVCMNVHICMYVYTTTNERREAGLETDIVKVKEDDDEVYKYVHICVYVCMYVCI
jgi:hypothetical protein